MTLAFVALLTWRSAVRRSALTFWLLLGAGLAALLTSVGPRSRAWWRRGCG